MIFGTNSSALWESLEDIKWVGANIPYHQDSSLEKGYKEPETDLVLSLAW